MALSLSPLTRKRVPSCARTACRLSPRTCTASVCFAGARACVIARSLSCASLAASLLRRQAELKCCPASAHIWRCVPTLHACALAGHLLPDGSAQAGGSMCSGWHAAYGIGRAKRAGRHLRAATCSTLMAIDLSLASCARALARTARAALSGAALCATALSGCSACQRARSCARKPCFWTAVYLGARARHMQQVTGAQQGTRRAMVRSGSAPVRRRPCCARS